MHAKGVVHRDLKPSNFEQTISNPKALCVVGGDLADGALVGVEHDAQGFALVCGAGGRGAGGGTGQKLTD